MRMEIKGHVTFFKNFENKCLQILGLINCIFYNFCKLIHFFIRYPVVVVLELSLASEGKKKVFFSACKL